MRRITFLLIAALCCLTASARASVPLLDLPKSTKSIEKEAFCNMQSLQRVVLPEGVQTIGARAFAGIALEL